MIQDIQYIREHIAVGEILAQLSEEADEVAQAALKLRRTLSSANPTPVTTEEAYQDLLEELGDVSLCLNILEMNQPQDLLIIQKTMVRKAERWVKRHKEMNPQCVQPEIRQP